MSVRSRDPVQQSVVPEMRLHAIFPDADVLDQAIGEDHPEHPQASLKQTGSAELAGVHQQRTIKGTAEKHTAARVMDQALVVIGERGFLGRLVDFEQGLVQALEVGHNPHGIDPGAQRLAHGITRLDDLCFLAPGIAVNLQRPISDVADIGERAFGKLSDDLLAFL
ncbi:hypothetical protein D3C73_805450 [compost metagenome]